MIKRKNRIFAFTFGHGWHFLKEEKLVHNFGFRAALNALQYDSIRSLDSFSIEDQAIHTRTQASKASAIGSFGIDIGKDILKGVTGKPRVDVKFTNISGSDTSLGFSVKTEFQNLGTVCDTVLDLYNETTYRTNFGWVDYIKRERSGTIKAQLEQDLVDDLRSNSPDAYLAPPGVVDWERFECFKISGGGRKTYSDLDISEYISFNDKSKISIDTLKSHRVEFYSDSSKPHEHHWTVFRCLNFETEISKKRYFLNDGEWFAVNKEYSKRITESLNQLQVSGATIPKIKRKADGKLEHEGEYNIRVCNENPMIALMDKKTVKCLGAKSQIEVCDLLTDSRQYIHVKHKKGGSSNLSHLFMQARNSAEALVSDETFRKAAREKLKGLRSSWEGRITINRPNTSEIEIILAFLGSKSNLPGHELPFFSQVSLVRTYEALISMGYKFSILGIQPEP